MNNSNPPDGEAPRPQRLLLPVLQLSDLVARRAQTGPEAALALGQRVRARRLAVGISQTELAQRAGVSQGLVAIVEAGRGNRLMAAQRLLEVMDAAPAHEKPRLPTFRNVHITSPERIALMAEDPEAYVVALLAIAKAAGRRPPDKPRSDR